MIAAPDRPAQLPTMPFSMLRAYLLTIRHRAEGVARADRILRQVGDAIDSGTDDDIPDSSEVLFDGIHLLLTHAAALSRVFFPTGSSLRSTDGADMAAHRAARAKRGQELRAWFDVSPQSPLSPKARRLRNTVEHWDERIEEWHEDVLDKTDITDSWVGRPIVEEPSTHYVLRRYDPQTYTVSWAGDRENLDLRPLVREAERIEALYASRLGAAVTARNGNTLASRVNRC